MYFVVGPALCVSTIRPPRTGEAGKAASANKQTESSNRNFFLFFLLFLFLLPFSTPRKSASRERQLNTRKHKQDCNGDGLRTSGMLMRSAPSAPILNHLNAPSPPRSLVTSITHGTVPHKTNMKNIPREGKQLRALFPLI
jgi:hypothetical protein